MAETLAQRVVNTFGLTKDQRTSALERGKNIQIAFAVPILISLFLFDFFLKII